MQRLQEPWRSLLGQFWFDNQVFEFLFRFFISETIETSRCIQEWDWKNSTRSQIENRFLWNKICVEINWKAEIFFSFFFFRVMNYMWCHLFINNLGGRYLHSLQKVWVRAIFHFTRCCQRRFFISLDVVKKILQLHWTKDFLCVWSILFRN